MKPLITDSILDSVLARTVADVADRKRKVPFAALQQAATRQPPAISLHDGLAGQDVSVIAEIKRASPSRGVFPVDVDSRAVARQYIEGGAAAISVLTDDPFFHGCLSDLVAAAAVAHEPGIQVPILRKDFVIEEYQIVEARAHGADAVLLIVAALTDAGLINLLRAARKLGMDALVEVHDEGEMRRAIAAGADVIGINNRDLKTFTVDLGVTERLAPFAPPGAVVVAESGVFGHSDVERLRRAGADAVLVGEGVITAADRAAAVRALRAFQP